jgi:phosphatidylinositol kinase/protein kinase (PI-3  family)
MQLLADFLKDIAVIYKKGMDMRQELVGINLIRLMDHVWYQCGINTRMSHYDTIHTSTDSGFVSLLEDASTLEYSRPMCSF